MIIIIIHAVCKSMPKIIAGKRINTLAPVTLLTSDYRLLPPFFPMHTFIATQQGTPNNS